MAVNVGLGVNVNVGVNVGVAVGRGVRVGDGVHVGRGVFVGVRVHVGMGVRVAVGVAESAAIKVCLRSVCTAEVAATARSTVGVSTVAVKDGVCEAVVKGNGVESAVATDGGV